MFSQPCETPYKLFTSSIPTLQPLLRKKCNFSWRIEGENVTGYSAVGHCRGTLRLGTAGIFGFWTLQANAGILCNWSLQVYFVVRHCRDTWFLGTAGICCGWAPQGYLVVRHCSDTCSLGTAGIHCHLALQSGSESRARTT